MKALTLVLIVVLLTGCATTGAGDGYAKKDGSYVASDQKDEDARSCQQRTMTWVSIPLFLAAVIPGLVVLLTAASMEHACMDKKGYTMQTT
jgi:hypothetical protein